MFNPIYRTANLQLNLTPLIKHSKILFEKVKDISYNIVRAENNLRLESGKKKKEVDAGLKKVYIKYNKFKKIRSKIWIQNRMRKKANVKVSEDTEPFSKGPRQ